MILDISEAIIRLEIQRWSMFRNFSFYIIQGKMNYYGGDPKISNVKNLFIFIFVSHKLKTYLILYHLNLVKY